MKYTAFLRPCAWGLALALAVPLAWGQSGTHRMVDPGQLTWAPVPSLPPGAQLAVIEGPMSDAVPFTVRLKFPAGYSIPPHWHPAVERVTVISGTFHVGTGERIDKSAGHAMVPGAIVILPARHPHYAWTDSETVVQLHGTGPWGVTYLNPADDPRGRPAAKAGPLSREQVRAERVQAQRAGELLAPGEAGLPRKQLDPSAMASVAADAASRGPGRAASRADVRAQYLAQRVQVEALTGEDSGSAYLAAARR